MKMLMYGRIFLVSVLALSCFATFGSRATLLPDEAEVLRQIFKTLGKVDWNFTGDPCSGEASLDHENRVTCNNNCSYSNSNSTFCHVESIIIKRRDLRGKLPPELVKLPNLKVIDLTRNFLSGTIPSEWGGFMQLESISLVGNRLSGPIPKELGTITTLKFLELGTNQFTGTLPPEIGNLVKLEKIALSSNLLSGELPTNLTKLTNLTDFRISDNNFTGKIPDFIQNWKSLDRIEIQGSGLQGPIPSWMSLLEKITDLRISDINGTSSNLTFLSTMTSLRTLILRNCNITGRIPPIIGSMTNLKTLDLSFNKLVGQIPIEFNNLKQADFIYLTSNMLTGWKSDLLNRLLEKNTNIDLSYNNFSLGTSEGCRKNEVNLYGSSDTVNNSSEAVPCLKSFPCSGELYWLHINCGGKKETINKTTFSADQEPNGASTFFHSQTDNWGFSSTGNFMDNGDNDKYIAPNESRLSVPDSDVNLYTTARLSPLSLTYFGLCLRNENYTVKLYFAEIMFTPGETYKSLGKRIFDIYIQGKLVWKDFNIEHEAGGIHKAVVKNFTRVAVTNNSLEIRFYWAGKGTTSIPDRGTYGPLISAISVEPEYTPPSEGGKKISVGAVVGIVASALCVIFLVLGIIWWKRRLGKKLSMYEDLRRLDLQTGSFTLRQIKAATNNFDVANKIGEGGFGPVYKGLLSDGSIIAVKQLSSKSKQGNREFVNEIGMISALQHPNLVKLYGCCIEGNQLLLVYEYMENNSLARALFGSEEQQLNLDWPTRHRICIGIARGLAYLHEESRLKIVHRDIKATNVLLDKDLNPKISDFGLAKLDEEENTHISTRIAGTIGYMAPEYAMRGYLTDKADVYSFGIVALEIVSGKSNTIYRPKEDSVYLLDWAYVLQERGSLIKLVDPKLGSEFNKEEAMGMLTVALLCTNASYTLRPSMSSVVSMLEGQTEVEGLILNKNSSGDDLRFKAMWNDQQQTHSQEQSQSQSQSQGISMDGPFTGSSTSATDLYPINMDSKYWNDRE